MRTKVLKPGGNALMNAFQGTGFTPEAPETCLLASSRRMV
jgi:hypothetical protein